MRPILTITGSDSTGLSGMQADVRTISFLGAAAASALTCLTVQTSAGIQEFFDVPAPVVSRQIEAVFADAHPDVVKVGLMRSRSVVEAVVESLLRHRPRHVVYDPMFLSSRGEVLVPVSVRQVIEDTLLPLCTYVVHRDRTPGQGVHGLSNAKASAVCVYLNNGLPLPQAIERADEYAGTLIARSLGMPARSAKLYNDFLALIGTCLKEHRDVAYYAGRLNISVRYLDEVCRQTAGKTPKGIIRDQLVRQAETLLATTTWSVQQIAATIGLRSQAHLAKLFRQQKRMSPSQYRKKCSL